MTLDRVQGRDAEGRRFGFVHGDDGGYFFTWHPTLDETLDSLEPEEGRR